MSERRKSPVVVIHGKNSYEGMLEFALTAVRGFAPVDIEPVVVGGSCGGIGDDGFGITMLGYFLKGQSEDFVDALLLFQGSRDYGKGQSGVLRDFLDRRHLLVSTIPLHASDECVHCSIGNVTAETTQRSSNVGNLLRSSGAVALTKFAKSSPWSLASGCSSCGIAIHRC